MVSRVFPPNLSPKLGLSILLTFVRFAERSFDQIGAANPTQGQWRWLCEGTKIPSATQASNQSWYRILNADVGGSRQLNAGFASPPA